MLSAEPSGAGPVRAEPATDGPRHPADAASAVDAGERTGVPGPVQRSEPVVRLLRVHGADRPGIVSALTAVVAAAGGSITDLTTRLRAGLYVLLAELVLPADADADQLTAKLRDEADRLGVEATLSHLDADEL
ncbi:MAG: ACT domain-containing protein [Angustibacter sp.]